MVSSENDRTRIRRITNAFAKTVALVIFATMFSACQKENTAVNRDVFISGTTITNQFSGVKIAAYWQNGNIVMLTDGTYSATAPSIFVSGGSVYVAGSEASIKFSVAKYWKDGVAVPLTDGTHDATATSIFVSGGDVYVAGWEKGGAGNAIAKFWKNGQAVVLGGSNTISQANSIQVSGSDVYIAGYELADDGETSIARCWKNGTVFDLQDADGIQPATAYSVFISGTDVYVGGNQHYANGSKPYPVAKYWKNGNTVDITTGNLWAAVNSITISGSDIYAAGYELDGSSNNEVAKYWKNGIPVTLSDGTENEQVTAIAYSGSSIYVNVTSAGSSRLFVDGKTVVPFDGTNLFIRGTGIFIR